MAASATARCFLVSCGHVLRSQPTRFEHGKTPLPSKNTRSRPIRKRIVLKMKAVSAASYSPPARKPKTRQQLAAAARGIKVDDVSCTVNSSNVGSDGVFAGFPSAHAHGPVQRRGTKDLRRRFCRVCADSGIVSTICVASASRTTSSSFHLGQKFTNYSAPR